jgi:hypothetical protein
MYDTPALGMVEGRLGREGVMVALAETADRVGVERDAYEAGRGREVKELALAGELGLTDALALAAGELGLATELAFAGVLSLGGELGTAEALF